ncbi:polysaccharide deacetylase family protein [Candidatus Saccharibacteria bacterium]|nr:polysaccharide deacetylase family protein [Candidatus Saccharibacteria bacterium]
MIETSFRKEVESGGRLARAKKLKRKKMMLAGLFILTVAATVVGIWFVTRNGSKDGGEVAVSEAWNENKETTKEEVKTSETERVISRKSGGRNLLCEVEDMLAPEMTLKGSEMRTIVMGSEYVEEGVEVQDNCDKLVEVGREGTVDANVAGVYEVKYKAEDAAGNKSEKVRTVRVVNPSAGERVVYLTFDDGPSDHTGRLLDVLKKYGVKVTFFVTGRGDDALIKREFEEGHTVALHTNTHNYAYLYSSDAAYFEDLYAVRDRVQRLTGVAPTLIRFPGGSSNTVSALYSKGIMSRLVGAVEARGFKYADWNVSSGDAGGAKTADDVFVNVVTRFGEGQYVVLQHDTMGFSVDAVERIIQYGMENGYTFMPMNETSFLAHHGVNN